MAWQYAAEYMVISRPVPVKVRMLPFVFAAVFAGSLHGVHNPVFVIFDFIKRDAPRAKSAMCNRMGRITFHFYDFIVFDRNDDAASDWVVTRGGPYAGPYLVRPVSEVFYPTFLFTHFSSPLISSPLISSPLIFWQRALAVMQLFADTGVAIKERCSFFSL